MEDCGKVRVRGKGGGGGDVPSTGKSSNSSSSSRAAARLGGSLVGRVVVADILGDVVCWVWGSGGGWLFGVELLVNRASC